MSVLSSLIKSFAFSTCFHECPFPPSANHSCLGVEAVWRRRLSPFLAHTFVPDVVIVSCSFLTFYVDCGHSTLAARDGAVAYQSLSPGKW